MCMCIMTVLWAGFSPGFSPHAQLPEAPPFRRYATHDSYEEGIGLPSSTAGAQLRQQHSTSRLLLRGVPGGGERGGTHPGNVPGSSPYDRDLPDRGWSQSAPPLGNAGGPHGAGGTMTGRMGGNHGVIGGRGGGIEYAAPVPRHHRQHEGGGHNLAAIGSLSASTSAGMGKEGSSNGGVSASGVGGGGGARWDRDPPRDTMAFASSKYPPGCFPSGGVYGEGAIFEQVRINLHGYVFSVVLFMYLKKSDLGLERVFSLGAFFILVQILYRVHFVNDLVPFKNITFSAK